ncbi:MAG: alpha/beta fold hydrolase [Solirubrobacteraceae bacterium]
MRLSLAQIESPPEIAGATHRWVIARGLRFHLAQAGSGPDAVLLLHGWPQHFYEWRHLMPELAERHRVLALDLRGFGWSEAPASGYRKEEMASDVLAVLDELELERVKLVGHDWGGWIGFLLCLRAAERFERFLAFNVVHPWQSPAASLPHLWRLWYQCVISTPGLGYLGHRSGVIPRLALELGVRDRSTWIRDDALRSFVDCLSAPDRARASVQLYRDFVLHELPELALGRYAGQRLTVPTRIVFGTNDGAMSPRQLQGAEANADRLEVRLVPGCGHFIVDERPDLVTAEACGFLA